MPPSDATDGRGMSAYELYVLGLDRVATEWDRLGPLLAEAATLVRDATIGKDLGFEETAPDCEVYDAMRTDLATAFASIGHRFTTEAQLLRTLDAAYHRIDGDTAHAYRALGRTANGHPIPPRAIGCATTALVCCSGGMFSASEP